MGPVYDRGTECWRILTNTEIYVMVKKATIAEAVRLNGHGMWQIWGENKLACARTQLWWVNLWQRDLFEHLGIDGRVMLQLIINK